MSYTVSDFYNTFKEHLQIVAGSGGLSNPVSDCGLLDYELIPELKEAYFQSNFQKDQLILTSLVYTKDNPYGILDAVKHLISKGASGLVIKNVFRLPISESVVRYADAKNFPVFLIPTRGLELSFEEIIYTVNRRSELQESADYHREILNRIAMKKLSGVEASLCAMDLNPSFKDRFFAVFVELDEFISEERKLQLLQAIKDSEACTFEDFAGFFQDGILFVKTSDQLQNYYSDFYIDGMVEQVFANNDVTGIGISSMHNTLEDFGTAMEEALFAAAYQSISSDARRFEELGSYRFLFNTCHTPSAIRFVRQILEPVEEYDSISNTSLMETLEEYVKADCEIAKTADTLGQHEQTVRYRLNRIYDIIGLNRKSQADTQQLILACQLRMAARTIAK